MFIKLNWVHSYGLSFMLNINTIEQIDENQDGTATIVLSRETDDVLYVKESYEEICDLLSEVE